MPNRWVIPDIHGCVNTLKTLIEEKIRPGKQDELFFLGDYIDRGPESRKVIDYVRNMHSEGYSVTLLKGNHEDVAVGLFDSARGSSFRLPRFLDSHLRGWFKIGGRETLESFGVRHVEDIPEEYVSWMKSLSYYALTDNFLLVHAGLNFSMEDPFTDLRSMLWVRDYNIKPEKIGNRRIVHGHVPVHLELIYFAVKDRSHPYIDLDNGPYIRGKDGFGNLVALELSSMELVIQDNLDYLI